MSGIVRMFFLPVSVVLLGLALSGCASAPQKTLREQVIGSWTLVASDNYAADGTLRQLLGANPKGSLILGADGRYTQIQLDPNRPRFKSNNRLTGTPEENTAAVKGATVSFGTWSVDEKEGTLTYKVEGALYPNAQGGTETRQVTLTGDEMKYTNRAAAGGSRAEVIYRRIK